MVSKSIIAFRTQTTDLINGYPLSQVFNTDQSGFNIEFLSGRTLTNKGEQIVKSSINQSHSKTHSYTIQPMLRMDGVLPPRILIVLQEKGGVLGPQVKQPLFEHPEILIKVNSSVKVGKIILKEWFAEAFFPLIEREAILILDSLSTYKNQALFDQEKPDRITYIMSAIPAGLTGTCQPLDVYFFRLYKAFARYISDYINYNKPDIKLHLRNTILHLQSCVFFQFRSPRFNDCFKYAWFKSGLLENFDRWLRFADPNKFCFPENIFEFECTSQACGRTCFIRCSWCNKTLCFEHFFNSPCHPNDIEFLKFHYCNKYEPAVEVGQC